MLYPTYAQLYDYCAGFMQADLSWFNNYFATYLSQERDITPNSYLLFYRSLSISSTYLTPLIFISFCYVAIKIIQKTSPSSKKVTQNFMLVMYNFFLSGICFATVGSIQGSFLNPMQNNFSLSSVFYLLGTIIFLIVLGESIWSISKDQHNIFKLRILVKSILLSVLHYNALYLFPLVIGFEAFFIYLKLTITKCIHPKLWLISNILPNLSLFLLV